jgi:hypothetical protein
VNGKALNLIEDKVKDLESKDLLAPLKSSGKGIPVFY